jgi:hypothetical protein
MQNCAICVPDVKKWNDDENLAKEGLRIIKMIREELSEG